ncbi:MAG TPA: hypothetical protein PLD82_09070, partial [Spirochaetota bacterium]|nr:hypothetical protein [Spirochaetota bacterium]
PLVYIAVMLPAWIAGRSMGDLLTIYVGQAKMFSSLTLHLPNMYEWLPAQPVLSTWGLVATGAFVIGIVWFALSQKKQEGPVLQVQIALLSALAIPFLLPHMHERYYFIADVLAILYAFLVPGRWYLPVMIGGTSFFAYQPFLFAKQGPVPAPILALVIVAAIGFVARDMIRSYAEKTDRQAIPKPARKFRRRYALRRS